MIDPHTAVGLAAARSAGLVPRCAGGDARDRASGQVPRCGRARDRACVPPLPARVGDLFDREERYDELPGDYEAVTAYSSRSARRG